MRLAGGEAMVTGGPESLLFSMAATLPGTAVAIESGCRLHAREGDREVVPSGFRGLDALLPAGGVRRGSLVEWLAVAPADEPGQHAEEGMTAGGSGAVTLAGAVACRLAAARPVGACPAGSAGSPARMIVVVDRSGWFHPPALLPWLDRTDQRQLVVVRPARVDDEIWAIDQALRCSGVAAVLAWPRAVSGRGGPGSWRQSLHQWTVAMRRWQLAARSSGAVGLFVRPQWARREPTWAEARIAVVPLAGGTLCERRLRLTRIGGAWSAAATTVGGSPQTADDAWGGAGEPRDIVLDMTRGCEPVAAGRRPPPSGERGAACRAS